MKAILLSLMIAISSIAVSQELEIYVSDAGGFNVPPWQILKFDENGQNPVVFNNTDVAWPQDILFLEESHTVLISNLSSNRITKHNATSGTYIENFATGISGPTRMKIGPDGFLYVLQWSGSGTVRRYNLDGTDMGDFTTVSVTQSIGLDWDADGNLYVSSFNGRLVRKFDTSGADMGVFTSANLAGPTNIWFDDNGDLLVSDYSGTAIKRYDANGNYVSDFITGLGSSEGVAFFPNGNILIGNGASSSVKLFDSGGTFIQDLIQSGSGNLINPNAVVLREKVEITDLEAPTAVLANVPTSVATEDPFMIDINFSEEVFGFTAQDLDVGNGSASDLTTTDGISYTVSITPNGIPDITVDLAEGKVEDKFGNANVSIDQVVIVYIDTEAPTVQLENLPASVNDNVAETITIKFSEDVVGFTIEDIIVTNGTADKFIKATASTYTVDIIATGTESVTIDIAENSVEDNSGNGNVALTQVVIEYMATITSIKESYLDYVLFPNPTSDAITIAWAQFDRMEVFSLAGRLVLSSNKKVTDVSALENGMYIVKMIGLNKEVRSIRLRKNN